MAVEQNFRVVVTEPSQTGEVRRQVMALAEAVGLDEKDVAELGILASEAAGNLVKHATSGGEVLARALRGTAGNGVELLILDRGPGIADLARALHDGYSTAGTQGSGLGAIGRIADRFEIHSLPGVGTAVLAHVWPAAGAQKTSSFEVGSVRVPHPGEENCGDACGIAMETDRLLIMVADGLGHGDGAADASGLAVRIFEENRKLAPAALIERIHLGLQATRGAAIAVADVQRAQRTVRYAGVGNIAGIIAAPSGSRHMVSQPGTVGHQLRRIQEFTYDWTSESVLVMASDGLATNWGIESYAGLSRRAPSLIAGVLYRDFTRGRDDVTVIVARETPT